MKNLNFKKMRLIITTLAFTILTLTTFGQKLSPIVGVVSLTQPTCFGYSNGEISLNISGGIEPYTYLWSNGDTTQTISNLVSGNYSVVVNDAIGQTIDGIITLPQPMQMIVQSVITNTTMNQQNGAIDITSVSNTDGTWSWSSNNTQTFDQSSIDQTNLMSGLYELTITYNNGCQSTSNFQVNNVITSINLPETNYNSPTLSLQNINNSKNIELTKFLDMNGKQVDIEKSPAGFYLVVENDILIQKIYKN